jgi:hypothetical protein
MNVLCGRLTYPAPDTRQREQNPINHRNQYQNRQIGKQPPPLPTFPSQRKTQLLLRKHLELFSARVVMGHGSFLARDSALSATTIDVKNAKYILEGRTEQILVVRHQYIHSLIPS